jgi:hypothetical protein
MRRRCVAAVAAIVLASCAREPPHRTFASPEEGVRALIDAVKAGRLDDVVAIFGPEGQDLIDTSDPVTARRHQQVFVVAAAERWRLEEAGPSARVLVIGYEDWPFPVPLVRAGEQWRFDAAAGREEVLARRIGRNELATILIAHTYVTAQLVYARRLHDAEPAGAYATKFRSDPGRENGLYWPAGRGQRQSPLGNLVAQAAEEGRPLGQSPEPSAFHGYRFRILTAQGASAPGGARNYIVAGRMSGGFALVAWPAHYDVTGVMTFIVGQDSTVYEKDLGPETETAAGTMRLFDPDPSWTAISRARRSGEGT